MVKLEAGLPEISGGLRKSKPLLTDLQTFGETYTSLLTAYGAFEPQIELQVGVSDTGATRPSIVGFDFKEPSRAYQ